MSADLFLFQALACYDLVKPAARFIRHNENAVWQITDAAGQNYILRVHKSKEGFSQDLFDIDKAASLMDELAVIHTLGKQGSIPVQVPVVNRKGEMLSRLQGGEYATLLTWLEGDTLEQAEITQAVCLEIGRMTACMHKCFQTDQDLCLYAGRSYDKRFIQRMKERLHAFGQSGTMPAQQNEAMIAALSVIAKRMAELDGLKDSYGVVHSDLSKSNMLLMGDRVAPIDFGLSGYGYYFMDLGSLAAHFSKEEEQQAIFTGYESVAGFKVEMRFVQPFISLGILLFICAFYEHVYQEEWFSPALDRWRQTFFQPLVAFDEQEAAESDV